MICTSLGRLQPLMPVCHCIMVLVGGSKNSNNGGWWWWEIERRRKDCWTLINKVMCVRVWMNFNENKSIEFKFLCDSTHTTCKNPQDIIYLNAILNLHSLIIHQLHLTSPKVPCTGSDAWSTLATLWNTPGRLRMLCFEGEMECIGFKVGGSRMYAEFSWL